MFKSIKRMTNAEKMEAFQKRKCTRVRFEAHWFRGAAVGIIRKDFRTLFFGVRSWVELSVVIDKKHIYAMGDCSNFTGLGFDAIEEEVRKALHDAGIFVHARELVSHCMTRSIFDV
jgi:hypothetical protein